MFDILSCHCRQKFQQQSQAITRVSSKLEPGNFFLSLILDYTEEMTVILKRFFPPKLKTTVNILVRMLQVFFFNIQILQTDEIKPKKVYALSRFYGS